MMYALAQKFSGHASVFNERQTIGVEKPHGTFLLWLSRPRNDGGVNETLSVKHHISNDGDFSSVKVSH